MSDYEVSYDKKTKLVTVECSNVFEDIRKGCKDVLILNALQAYAEVPLDAELTDAKGVEKAVVKKLDTGTKSLLKDMEDLFASLRKLQKEEENGNKKAADDAEKLVKDQEKAVKKWADTFGVLVRKSVQEEFTEQTKSKTQLRSTSRTMFRGMELNEDAFEGESAGGEATPFMADLSKSLAAAGKEVAKLTQQEKDLRKDLGLEIDRVQKLVENARAGKKDFDIREFLKANAKDARGLESSVNKYLDFLTSFHDKLEEAKKTWNKLDNLIDKAEKLDDEKSIVKQSDAYWDAMINVLSTLPGKIEATKEAQRLFKDDYKEGEAWKSVVIRYEVQKGATKSGKAMQDCGLALEKLTKG